MTREAELMANAELGAAKAAKDDEFYTQWADIEREMNAYLEFDPDVFRGKTILLPCDDPEWSNFTKLFALHFADFGLKKLISTSYAPNSNAEAAFYTPTLFDDPQFDEVLDRERGKIFTLTAQDISGDGRIDVDDLRWEYLNGDGDFRSAEVTALRDEADFVITNPPFSLFRSFATWLIEGKKRFSVIGSNNAITYAEVFPHIRYFREGPQGPTCAEECRDTLLELGVSRPTTTLNVLGGLVMTGVSRPIEIASGASRFDATEAMLRDLDSPVAGASTTALLLRLRRHAATPPSARTTSDDDFLGIWGELSQRGLDVIPILRVGVSPTVADVITQMITDLPASDAWRRLWETRLDRNSSSHTYGAWFATHVTEWLARLVETDVAAVALDRLAQSTPQTFPQRRDLSTDQFVSEAVRHLQEGRPDEAADIFTALAYMNPADGEALNNLGFCLIPKSAAQALASIFHDGPVWGWSAPVASRLF
ncbi:adenine-specific methyltransferase EcoRI family protein [Tessaracoccus defluvii]|nr:adenine-specific methyltransferase EcoRI family protein [Tessaracoccus defluvii]